MLRERTVYVNAWVVEWPTRSVAVSCTVCVESSGAVGTSKPFTRAMPSTVAVHDATPEEASAHRNASGTRPFRGTKAPGWSRATVGGALSTGAYRVAW